MTMLNGRVKGVDHLCAQANLWCLGSELRNAEFEFKNGAMKKNARKCFLTLQFFFIQVVLRILKLINIDQN